MSIAAVALSCALLIVVASLFGGFINQLDTVASSIFGDIYLDPWVGVPEYNQLLERLESLPQVYAATAVLETYGLLRLGSGNVRAVRVVGIDLPSYAKVTGFKDSLLNQKSMPRDPVFAATDYPDENAGFVSIGVLGKPDEQTDEYDFEGAKKTWLGKNVILTAGTVAQDAQGSGSPSAKRPLKAKHLKFRISDIVFVGMYYQDTQDIYVPIQQARVLTSADGAGQRWPHEVFKIKLAKGVKPDAALEPIRAEWEKFATEQRLPEHTIQKPLLETSKSMYIQTADELKKQMGVLMLIFGIICSVGVLLVFCIFYMIVMTKQKDIAVIKSCGGSSSSVASIFIGFGGCVGIVGSIIGAGLGYIVTKHINIIEGWVRAVFGLKLWKSSTYMFSKIPSQFDVNAACWIAGFAIVAAIIGALIPAIVAARTRPVEILRYE